MEGVHAALGTIPLGPNTRPSDPLLLTVPLDLDVRRVQQLRRFLDARLCDPDRNGSIRVTHNTVRGLSIMTDALLVPGVQVVLRRCSGTEHGIPFCGTAPTRARLLLNDTFAGGDWCYLNGRNQLIWTQKQTGLLIVSPAGLPWCETRIATGPPQYTLHIKSCV